MNGSSTRAIARHVEPEAAALIDLRKIYMAVRRRQWWVIGSFLLVLGLAILLNFVIPPRYTATAMVALDRKDDPEIVAQGADSGDKAVLTDSPSVDTAVSVLSSSRLIGEVVDALKLQNVEGFGQLEGYPVAPPDIARLRAIGAISNKLVVKRVGLSYAITVAFQNGDKRLAARLVNTLVDRYVADERSTKSGARDQQIGLIGARLQGLRNDVIRAEAAEAAYRGQHNLIDVQKDSTAVQQEISVLNTQLATAQADEAAARARLAAVTATGASAVDAATSPTMATLRQQQSTLAAQRADLAQRYGPLHPDLARVDQQLKAVNRQISAESARVRAQLQTDVRQAEGRAGAVRGSLGQAQGGLSAGNAASVQLNELSRNADSARSLYQAFLDRYRQSVAAQGTDQTAAYVVAHAEIPNVADFPNLMLMTALGVVGGIIAAAGLTLLLELLESGFQTRQEIESKLGLPVLATIPDLRTIPGVGAFAKGDMGPPNYVVEHDGSVFAEAFRSIRTALKLGYPDQTVRSLAICSPLPGEGKTTTAICLARSAALAGHRVILVDCDIRRRASSRSMAAGGGDGLTGVLHGTVPLERALLRDEATGLFILGQSQTGAIDFNLLVSQPMKELVETLSREFDLVVMDTAPVLPLAEARAVAGMADGVLLVTRWRRTPVRAARLAIDLLDRAGARIEGTALSLVNLKTQSRSGLGDEMLYYKKFKKYYTA